MTPSPPLSTTLKPVPNKPKTPLHSFRVTHELWNEAKALAVENGETIADVLRRALERYVRAGRKR